MKDKLRADTGDKIVPLFDTPLDPETSVNENLVKVCKELLARAERGDIVSIWATVVNRRDAGGGYAISTARAPLNECAQALVAGHAASHYRLMEWWMQEDEVCTYTTDDPPGGETA